MATESQSEREVIRCPSCDLNQYMTRSGLCRKPECGKPLKPVAEPYFSDYVIRRIKESIVDPLPVNLSGISANFSGLLTNDPKKASAPFYCPESPFTHPLAEAEKAIDTVKEILKSNVRRKKVDSRYKRDSMLIRDVPADFRLKLIEYCREHKTTLREVVIKSVQNTLDRE